MSRFRVLNSRNYEEIARTMRMGRKRLPAAIDFSIKEQIAAGARCHNYMPFLVKNGLFLSRVICLATNDMRLNQITDFANGVFDILLTGLGIG